MVRLDAARLCLLLLITGCANSKPVPPTRVVKVDAPAEARETDRAKDLNAKGLDLLAAQKWPGAEKVLTEAIDADPSFGPARNNLGVALYRQAKLYKAYQQFERAVELMPASADARNNLGMVLEDGDRLDDAVACFDRASALAPNDKEYFGNAVRARIHRGDRDDGTAAMLRKVAAEDDRPDWNQWARETLAKLRPTTGPSS